jgi:hypothetical protein
MLLAAAAMFFAMTGSAFLLRARMSSGCPYRVHSNRAHQAAVSPAPQPDRLGPARVQGAGCAPLESVGARGERLVEFRVCDQP